MTDTPFADGDTPESNPDHFANNATSFAIPISNGAISIISSSYDWMVNCGDNQVDQQVSGIVDFINSYNQDVICNYPKPGEYQITIKPNGHSFYGWMNAFSFSGSTIENSLMLKSLDTPMPKKAYYSTGIQYTFSEAKNAIGIPIDLLSLNTRICHFDATFRNFAYNSTTAVIPTGLFAGRDKAACLTGIGYGAPVSDYTYQYISFKEIFSGFAGSNHSNDGTPDTNINDIFSGVDFSGLINGTDGSRWVFESTFRNMPSLTGTAQTFIDTQLGGAIPSSRAYTFYGTSVTDLDQLNPNWK
jgi:hypothetical protein